MGTKGDLEALRAAHTLSAYPLAPELTGVDCEQTAQTYRACRGRGWALRSMRECLIAQLCLPEGYELPARDRNFDAIVSAFPAKRVPAG